MVTQKVRYHVDATKTPADANLTPKHLTKQEFGRRLYRLLLERGWNQSELARRADLPRDSVSTYIRGRSLPTPTSLKKIAEALGVEPENLLPNVVESAIDEDNPAFDLRVSPSRPGVAWVRVNRQMSFAAAVKISEIISNDDAPDRE
jgi:transcriptional regulator with XRE-family HTH domain